jgi:hypothetical protein
MGGVSRALPPRRLARYPAMSSMNYRPFWDGPIEDRIARLERQLATPAVDRDADALELALHVLQQVRAETCRPQLAS